MVDVSNMGCSVGGVREYAFNFAVEINERRGSRWGGWDCSGWELGGFEGQEVTGSSLLCWVCVCVCRGGAGFRGCRGVL